MGLRLVQASLGSHWRQHLSLGARCLYTHMALTAHDTGSPSTPAATYWGGRDDLIFALTGQQPPADSPAYRTAAKRVKSLLAELRAAGAIELQEAGGWGRRSRYLLTPAVMADAAQTKKVS